MRNLILISFALCISCIIQGQDVFEPPVDKLKVSATYSDMKIEIDGHLSESIWKEAMVLSDFIQVEPNQGEESLFKTTVRVLYDDKYLYIGAFCEEAEGRSSTRTPSLDRDFSFREGDTFAVGIDGFYDQRNSSTFATNPYGSQKDYLSFDDTFFDSEWNSLWKVRTSRTDSGWFAEFQIPWKTIRYGAADENNSKWGINFVRMRRKSNEISAWSSYPRAFGFNRSEYFGLLTDVKPPEPTTNIQINPYVLVDYKKQEVDETASVDYAVGGEVKWAVNSNTLLDFTINTDFAQVEADRQVNNISRFSVFFPEQRQFFLENASLFGSGLYSSGGNSGDLTIIPFFSRRIGLTSEGEAVKIDGGVRLVHQSGSRSYGVMGLRESGMDEIEGNSNFVGRYVQNIGKQNRLGFVATTSITSEGTNVVAGLDGFFRIDKVQSMNFMASSSLDSNNEKMGIGGYAQYKYLTNIMSGWLTTSYIGDSYNPGLGFVSRRNVIAISPGVILNYRGEKLPFKRALRAFKPEIQGNLFYEASSGMLAEREFSISPISIEAQNGTTAKLTTRLVSQNIRVPFSLLNTTIGVGDYDYTRYSFSLSTDPSKKMSLSVQYELGDFYNGSLKSLNASLSLVPIPNLFVKGSLSRNSFSELGGDLSSGKFDLYTIEGKVFVNPRLSLTGLYQYNKQRKNNFFNVRFAWEYSPLSYFYVVFKSNRVENIDDRFREEQIITKLSFLKQF